MDSVRVLGRKVSVDYLIGNGGQALDASALLQGLREAVTLINSKLEDYSPDEREAFRAMKRIVFFSGEIVVNSWKLSRPGCDEDDAIFYWEMEEFMRNTDADVRANTFFHDCWHVIQFQREGDFARDANERVVREVDAIARQIRVAKKLGCSDAEIAHLQKYIDDNPLIVARLNEGVRMAHAAPIGRGQA